MKWHPLVHRTKELLTKRFGVRSGDTLLAAVSGGADSICMLHLLHTLAAPLRLSLCCVHVHHGIRGASADRDAAFVRAFCEERGIPFVLQKVDAKAYAAAHPHVSLEEAARVLRYQALENAATAPRTFLCTAHNADDNAETVLLHLFRGTGLRGLAGMPEMRGASGSACRNAAVPEDKGDSLQRGNRTILIRPLLSVTRAEIEEYHRESGLSFVEDETNTDTAFARNALRHEILPVAAEKINAKASLHVTENAREVTELLRWAEGQTKEGFERCVIRADGDSDAASPVPYGGISFSVRALRAEDPFLQGGILKHALYLVRADQEHNHPASSATTDDTTEHPSDTSAQTSGTQTQKQITRAHIEDILALVRSDNGRAVLHLPDGLTVTRRHDELRLSPPYRTASPLE